MEDKIIVEGTKSHNSKDVDIDSAQKIGLVERNLNKVSFSYRMSFIEKYNASLLNSTYLAINRKVCGKAKVGSLAGNYINYEK